MSTETRPYTDFTSGLDQVQFFQEIVDDVTITTTINSVILIGFDTVEMIFASTLSGPEVTALDALIAAHVPDESNFPAFQPLPIVTGESLINSSAIQWTDASQNVIMAVHSNTVVMNHGLNIPITGAANIPSATGSHNILFFNADDNDLLYYKDSGGSSVRVGNITGPTGTIGPVGFTGPTGPGGVFTSMERTTVNSSTYNILTSDQIVAIIFNGAVTVTLPTAAAAGEGRFFHIVDEAGMANQNNITIATSGGNTIVGDTSVLMRRPYESISVYSDGTSAWYIY